MFLALNKLWRLGNISLQQTSEEGAWHSNLPLISMTSSSSSSFLPTHHPNKTFSIPARPPQDFILNGQSTHAVDVLQPITESQQIHHGKISFNPLLLREETQNRQTFWLPPLTPMALGPGDIAMGQPWGQYHPVTCGTGEGADWQQPHVPACWCKAFIRNSSPQLGKNKKHQTQTNIGST